MRLRCWQPNSSGQAQHTAFGSITLHRRHNASQTAVAVNSKFQTQEIEYRDRFCAQTAAASGARLTGASAAAHAFIAQQQQQLLHPVLQSCMHVQLLQQVALVQSWQAAEQLLRQHASQLQQAHVGLLWLQLQPKLLQCRQQQARLGQCIKQPAVQGSFTSLQPWYKADKQCTAEEQLRKQQQQQQQRVLQKLLEVTSQHVTNLSPQSLAYTIPGIAAAVAAGLVPLSAIAKSEQLQQQQSLGAAARTEESAVVLQLPTELPVQLWQRLLSVAATCTAQQLAHCIAGGRYLGWQLDTASSSSSSDTDVETCTNSNSNSSTVPAPAPARAAELCCWPVLKQAMSGVLGSGLRRRQQPQLQIDSREAGQMLHALAGYVQQQRLQQWHGLPEQQQHGFSQQCAWRPAFRQLVQRLADTSCTVMVEQQAMHTTYIFAQGVRRSSSTTRRNSRNRSGAVHDADGAVDPAAMNSARSSSAASSSSPGGQSSSSGGVAADSISALMCSLQAAALLQVLPNTQRLEAQLQQLQPLLQEMPATQLLQLLQALIDLNVEPWQSWLEVCYSRLRADMHLLQPQQLLQLLQLLPHVTRLQPDRQMLSGLTKVTAVHITSFNWRQLAVLPLGLVSLGHRPEPYWLKDYIAASTLHLQRQQQLLQQQQQQQRGQLQLQVQLLIDMMLGVSWLAMAAVTRPPAAWLTAVDQQLTSALVSLDRCSSTTIRGPAGNTPAPKRASSALQGRQQQATAVAAASSKLRNPANGQHHRRQRRQLQQRGRGQQHPCEVVSSEAAALVMAAFAQMQYTPSSQLQQLLGGGSCDTSSNTSGSNGSSGSTGSSSKQASRRRLRQRSGSVGHSSSSSGRGTGGSRSGSSISTKASRSCLSAVRAAGDQTSAGEQNSGLPLEELHHSHASALQNAAKEIHHHHRQQQQKQQQKQQQQAEDGGEQAPQLLMQPRHAPNSTATVQLFRQLEGLGIVHGDVQQAQQRSPTAALLHCTSVDGRRRLKATFDDPILHQHLQVDEPMLAAS